MESILRAREQFGDPAHRRGVHGESPLGREPGQVMRPAGLRAGAGEALAAEGLHSNYGADHAAVDVDVADARGTHHLVDEALDAAVDAEREAVAGAAQPLQHLPQVASLEKTHMQDRAEDFGPRQLIELELECDWSNVIALDFQLGLSNQPGTAAELLDVAQQRVARGGVDDRADVGVGLGRVADFQLGEGAREELQQARRAAGVDEQDARRRAALACALEGGDHAVVDDLLGERRGVDDHRVVAAGFGDERHDRPRALRQREIDALRGLDRAGEGDAGDARIGDQGCAYLAVAGHALNGEFRNTCLSEYFYRLKTDPWRLLRGLGDHRVARGKRGGDLAGEDGERKVPGADAGEDAAAVELQFVTLAGGTRKQLHYEPGFYLRGIVTAEIRCLAHFRHRVGVGAAALAHDERDQVEHALVEQVGGALQNRGTPGGGHARPGLEALRGASDGAIESDRWRRRKFLGRDSPVKRVKHIAARKIQAERGPAGRVDVARQRDARSWNVGLGQLNDWIGDQVLERHIGGGD